MNKWELLNVLYVNTGLRIFPVVPNGKTPLIEVWQKDCSSNFMQILYWVTNAKNCNWGLPASENNLFILDLDVHDLEKNGVENFKKLLATIGLTESGTLEQQTPSGGIHIIYQTDDDLKNVSNGSNVFKDYPGIDIRTLGYIVVHPSTINGSEYKFLNNLEPQPMPAELKEYVLANAGLKEGENKKPYEKPKEVYVGDRDNQLFKYINHIYYKTRLDFDEVLVLANYFNENILEKPFTAKEVKYKVKKAFEKDRGICLYVWLGEEE